MRVQAAMFPIGEAAVIIQTSTRDICVPAFPLHAIKRAVQCPRRRSYALCGRAAVCHAAQWNSEAHQAGEAYSQSAARTSSTSDGTGLKASGKAVCFILFRACCCSADLARQIVRRWAKQLRTQTFYHIVAAIRSCNYMAVHTAEQI